MSATYDMVIRARNQKGGAIPHPTRGESNRFWWPNRLNLRILAKNSASGDPTGEEFDYATEFETLDLQAVRRDIERVLTTSQPGSTVPGLLSR